jgi:glutamate/tyrosine decarboxylase-like PLP-dependent enzyme
MALPKSGLARDDVLRRLAELQARDVDWKSGRAFTLAYYAGEEVHELATAANAMYLSANALNVEAFPSLRRMQSEVVAMVAELLHGGPEAAGFMTSGGTESIVRAAQASAPQAAYGTLE